MQCFRRFLAVAPLALAFVLNVFLPAAKAQPTLGTAITYQGRLESGGTPVNAVADFQFTLWNAASFGNQIGSSVQVNNVSVRGGVFTAVVDFGQAAFTGGATWLEIAVRSPSGDGSFTTLAPRQLISASPFALLARNNWSMTGNAGSTPGPQFLGTTDNNSLVLKVNNRRAVQYDPIANFLYRTTNVLAGSELNSIAAGRVGATIAGGGGDAVTSFPDRPNVVLGDFGTVGGGQGNTAAEGATVSGGEANSASAAYATVAGGTSNTASGDFAFVAGGFSNLASGLQSFAAGTAARAEHEGAFVWSDSDLVPFASTGEDQFLIRARGGVGIGTNSPNASLDLTTALSGSGWQMVFTNTTNNNFRGGIRLASNGFFELTNSANAATPNFARLSSSGAWSAVSDARLKTDISNAQANLTAASKLRPVNFRWKSDGSEDLGLIAQEVRSILPMLVAGDEATESLTLNYSQLSVVAIGAIQELKAENDALKARIERLERLLEEQARQR